MIKSLIAAVVLVLTASGGQFIFHLPGGGTNPIDVTRRIDWSSAGVIGGIPSGSWTQCGSTISAYGTSGARQSAATINTAIQNCTANHYVLLGAGTFWLNTGITFAGKSNVVLRGGGGNTTFIDIINGSGCIIQDAMVCLSGSTSSIFQSPRNWTAGYAKGTTVLTLANTTSLTTNMLVFLDQIDDQSDTNSVLVTAKRASPLFFSQEAGSPGRDCDDAGVTCRSQQQMVKITAINGNQVTISPGLYMPQWVSGKDPELSYYGTIGSDVSTLDGLEELSIDSSSDVNSSTNVEFGSCYQCWMKGVRSVRTNSRNHVWMWVSNHNEVRDSYFFGSAGTSQSYGVEMFYGGDHLVINNIFHKLSGALEFGDSVGSVAAYNYIIDTYYTQPANWQICSICNHDAGNAYNLVEGNDTEGMYGHDDIHGTQNFDTAFRNRVDGVETGKAQQTTAWQIQAFNRFLHIIGNVIGDTGTHVVYQTATPTAINDTTAIFFFGYGACCSVPDDTLVSSTLMRWGNYDVVNGTRFVSAEVPSGLSDYPNAVPASQSLPASLFLSAKPAFFTNTAVTWPPIGPDVTGGDIPNVGGHAYRIPAKKCALDVMSTAIGDTVAKTFSTSACGY